MKLGFVSAILGELDFEHVLAFAKESGYSCVEMMCWPKGKAERRYAGVTHIDVTNLDKAAAKKMRSKALKSGITISGLGYYPNPLSPNPVEAAVYIKHLQELIKAAELLGVQVVNTFIGRDWTRSVDDNWPRFKQVWPGLIKFAEERGIKVAIENCPMFFTKDEWPAGKNLAHAPAIWRRMFEEIPSDHFGLNLDPSHLVWQQIDYLAAVREFKEKIFHVHAKDCRVDQHRLNQVGILACPLEFHTPKLPGLGDVDWGRFISVLGDNGYDGAVCVEVEDRAFEGSLQSRKIALFQSGAYLRQFIAE
ncbi:MAG TPA: sugar phosphate isomerase/epimerase [bacterium]|nr:sugar phosphate isomerase/epimerase [bacterium]HPN36143.1 sugar phosphate isomerase/epimerase [bacterium]